MGVRATVKRHEGLIAIYYGPDSGCVRLEERLHGIIVTNSLSRKGYV